MGRRLLCLNCAKRAKPVRENHGVLVMFCTGTLKLDRALSDIIVGSGDEEKRYPAPSPCVCDFCNEPIEKGERACCYQYWRQGQLETPHGSGWEHDYLGGELVYEWRDY